MRSGFFVQRFLVSDAINPFVTHELIISCNKIIWNGLSEYYFSNFSKASSFSQFLNRRQNSKIKVSASAKPNFRTRNFWDFDSSQHVKIMLQYNVTLLHIRTCVKSKQSYWEICIYQYTWAFRIISDEWSVVSLASV